MVSDRFNLEGKWRFSIELKLFLRRDCPKTSASQTFCIWKNGILYEGAHCALVQTFGLYCRFQLFCYDLFLIVFLHGRFHSEISSDREMTGGWNEVSKYLIFIETSKNCKMKFRIVVRDRSFEFFAKLSWVRLQLCLRLWLL